MLSFITKMRKARSIEAVARYSAPHWIVMIRNPGDKEWTPLLDNEKKVENQNEFAEIIKTRAAVRTFLVLIQGLSAVYKAPDTESTCLPPLDWPRPFV